LNYEPIALDSGFGYTEALSTAKRSIMPSVAGEPIDLLDTGLVSSPGGIVSEVNSRKLFVGDLAIRQSPARYHSLKENKPDDEIAKFIGLTAISMVLPEGQSRCRLVTALPVSHYFGFKAAAEQSLLGHHVVTVNGSRKVFTVDQCRTTVQGLEAVFDQILSDSGTLIVPWATQTIAVIDVGFYTTNLVVINRLEPVRKLCKSIPVGISAAWKLLANFLYKEKGIELNLYELDEIVKTKTVQSKGLIWDISKPIEFALKSIASEINGQIETLWPQRPFARIFGAGGGMLQLGPKILPGELEILKDPQGANVRGGLKLARRETTWQQNCG
jgi:plasmid segregation protein ParM